MYILEFHSHTIVMVSRFLGAYYHIFYSFSLNLEQPSSEIVNHKLIGF